MKKHIKNAAGLLLMVAAIYIACLTFQEPHQDQVQLVLDHWPSIVLIFALAFAGVALVDTRAAQGKNWAAELFRPARGETLDRFGALCGVDRLTRKTFTLPRGGQVRIMESDTSFRRRIRRAAYGTPFDSGGRP